MAVHTCMYWVKNGDPGAYVAVPAIIDQVFGFRNDGHVPGVPMSLVALAANGKGGTGGSLESARVQSPKTVISAVYARPVNNQENTFPSNPAFNSFVSNPVLMRAGEEISASAKSVNGNTDTTIVAWFNDRWEALPQGESYWVPFSATLDHTIKEKWQTTSITFTDTTTLPAGRYAILGLHLVLPDSAAVVLCGRLVIPGETYRPGTIVSPRVDSLTPPFVSDGSLGVWGRFDAQVPPSLEVFATTLEENKTTMSGFLRVAPIDR